MKFLIHPAVEPERLSALQAAAPVAEWVNAADPSAALAELPEADAFLGKITPELLARAGSLRWVQAFTASLEHYLFPELAAHPCVLTNTRGRFGDVIADQVRATSSASPGTSTPTSAGRTSTATSRS